MRWLYAHFPQLQLDRLLRMEQQLSQLPVVLYEESGRPQRIVQANSAARALGISEHMALPKAWLMTENLRPLAWQAKAQAQELQQLCAYLYRSFSDIYPDPPDGLWLNLQPMQRLHADTEVSVQLLQQCLAKLAVMVRVKLAQTPLAARALARAQCENIGQLPVTSLPAEPVLHERLQRLGMNTLADVQRHPRALLGRRLGEQLVSLLYALEQNTQAPSAPFHPPSFFYQRTVLMAEAKSWQALQFSLKRQLRELELYLEGRQQLTCQIQLRLYHRDHEPTSVIVGIPHGAWRVDEMMPLCQLKMANQVWVAPVLEISLSARRLRAREAEHRDLWQAGGQYQQPLSQVLNQLQLRLGEAEVMGLQTISRWVPEDAWQRTSAGQVLGHALPAARPCWLLQQPQNIPIDLWSLECGPERLRIPWWSNTREESVRDYYHARDQEGVLAWVFYCYQQQQWYVHGWFDA
ncbi:MAG: DNA polymerase Y family protein [Idiomarina sp.]|nr:DNA polymerase Y family protein [Idiomarina sp.]